MPGEERIYHTGDESVQGWEPIKAFSTELMNAFMQETNSLKTSVRTHRTVHVYICSAPIENTVRFRNRTKLLYNSVLEPTTQF